MPNYTSSDSYSIHASGINPPARQLMIPSAMDEIQNAIESLAKTAGELELRLARLCVSEPLMVNANPANVPPQLSTSVPVIAEHAQDLLNKANQIRNVRDWLQQLLSRLEL